MIRNLTRRVGAIALVAASTWLGLCLVLYLLFHRTLTDVYQQRVRNVLQAECGRMVEGPLIYTLTPGTCLFENPEFRTRLTIDPDGFRNEPLALGSGPVLVAVVGDSHALGWGVEQSQTLSSLLARDPRFTVRSLAMSSYGTAREMMALERFAADADVIVLQYCDNDYPENMELLTRPADFISGARARAQRYQEQIIALRRARETSPGAHAVLQHAFAAVAATWRLMLLPPRSQPSTPVSTIEYEALAFSKVLLWAQPILAGKTVIVMENHPKRPRENFARVFANRLTMEGLGHVAVLDLAGTIVPRDYFHIDEHMRASGHAKVAARVLAELDRLAPKRRAP